MNRHLASALSLALATGSLWLSGCASVPEGTTRQVERATRFTPPPDHALLYVYREFNFHQMTVVTELSLDGRRFGSIAPKTYLCAAVKPGSHALEAQSFFGDAPQKFSAEAGQLYFFRVAAKPEEWKLDPVSEPEAREQIAEFTLSGDNAYEAGRRE